MLKENSVVTFGNVTVILLELSSKGKEIFNLSLYEIYFRVTTYLMKKNLSHTYIFMYRLANQLIMM